MPERRISREGEGGRDRRIIERFHEPRIQQVLKYQRFWVWVLVLIFLAAGVWSLARGLVFDPSQMGQNIFYACMLFLYSAILFNYNTRIKYYLKNESIENLVLMVERQLHVAVTIVIFVLLGFAVASIS